MSRLQKALASPWGEAAFIALVVVLAGVLFLWQTREVDLRVKETQAALDDQAAAWSDLLHVKFMAFDELLSLPEGLTPGAQASLIQRRFAFWTSTSNVPGLVTGLWTVTTTTSESGPPALGTVDAVALAPGPQPASKPPEALVRRAIGELWNDQGFFRLHVLLWESGRLYLTIWTSDSEFSLMEFDPNQFFGQFLKDLTDRVFPIRSGALPDYVPAVVESGESRRVLFSQFPVVPRGKPAGSYALADGDLVPEANPVQDTRLAEKLKALGLDYSYYLERSLRGDLPNPAAPPQGALAFTYLPSHGDLRDLMLGRELPMFALGYAALVLLSLALVTVSRYGRRMAQLMVRQEEFVSTMTHELRTPLHILSNGADNLADGIVSAPAEVRRYGQVLRGEAARLSQMVEGILTYAGVGRHAPVQVAFALDGVVDEALAPYRILCRESSIDLEEETTPGKVLVGDPEAVKLILSNLLSNAVHHGASGRWVRVEAKAGRDLTLTVRDRGPGLTRGQIAHLEEPYFRMVSPRGSHRFGHGLGLSIVQRIVKAAGGRLVIAGKPGAGCTFTVTLPYREQE